MSITSVKALGRRLYERHKSFFRFAVAGSLASISDLVLLYLFHGRLGLSVIMATTLAFILSFGISFSLQKFWTFGDYSRHRTASQLILYLLTAGIGLGLNAGLMHLFVRRYHIWYLLAQVIVIGLIGVFNFLSYNFIIFKKSQHETVRL